MRIKKIAVMLLSALVLLSSISLFACGGHKHVYDYTCNAVNHWQECICGEVKKNSEAPHEFENGMCSICDQNSFTEGLEFVRVEGEEGYTYHVKSYTGTATEVKIPSAVCGKVLNGIAHRAFMNNASLTKISIPETITYVGDDAFKGCTSLTYYENNGLQYLGNEWNNYLYLAKTTNTELASATINQTCVVVGSGAFEGHQKLGAVVIPTSVKCFAKDAFKGCLTAVLKNVNYLGTADEWAQITFSEPSANPIFYSKQLYIQGKLLRDLVLSAPVISDYAFFDCDSIRTISFNEGVTYIGNSAFEGCNAYTKTNADGYTFYFDTLIFPSTLKYIGHSAFRYCANVKLVNIPEGIEYVGEHSFANCIRMSKVVYGGTMDSWNKEIFVGENWNFQAKAIQLQCSDGFLPLRDVE